MEFHIASIPGDGIGPEIIQSATSVLARIGRLYGHDIRVAEVSAGGAAMDETGDPLPKKSLKIIKSADAILMGTIGGPKWDKPDIKNVVRPEDAVLEITKELGYYADIRPMKLYPELQKASPIKPEFLEKGIDCVIVREFSGGLYHCEKNFRNGRFGREAYDTEVYSDFEIERIAKRAFSLAQTRKKSVLSLDMANKMLTSKLWRKIVDDTSKDYPDVTLEHMFADIATIHIVRRLSDFDVILTSNLFGDILSDLAAVVTSGVGLMPSASIGEKSPALYSPIHGSFTNLAGLDKANPIGTIMSAAMMLRLSFGLEDEADAIENAVETAISDGCRTGDIARGEPSMGTKQITLEILNRIVRK